VKEATLAAAAPLPLSTASLSTVAAAEAAVAAGSLYSPPSPQPGISRDFHSPTTTMKRALNSQTQRNKGPFLL